MTACGDPPKAWLEWHAPCTIVLLSSISNFQFYRLKDSVLDVSCEHIFTPAQEVISILLSPQTGQGKYHLDIPEGVDLELIFYNLMTLAFHSSTDLCGVGGNAKCNTFFFPLILITRHTGFVQAWMLTVHCSSTHAGDIENQRPFAQTHVPASLEENSNTR